MKKYFLVLGMIACIFSLTACGSEKTEETSFITKEDAEATAQSLFELVQFVGENDMLSQYENYQDYDVLESAVNSWDSAQQDIGDFVEIVSTDTALSPDEAVVELSVKGTQRDAVVEIILAKDNITSITTNVKYTFGESMGRAGLNTLLGMGTVFVVLVLISFIIAGFGSINKLEASMKKKEVQPEVKEPAAPVIAESAQEDLTDDLELVAVIAAAVAASEGAESTDGFVVRSIRRSSKSKWQRA